MGRSRGFGSITCDLIGLFTLGFPSPAVLRTLGLPQTITRRLIMQKVRGQPALSGSGLPLVVGIRVQVLLILLTAVLFNVQSPYWFTIGRAGVFSLGRWSARIHTRFHEPRATLVPLGALILSLTGLSPSLAGFSKTVLLRSLLPCRGPQPRGYPRFGLFRVRSPLLTESISLSFPPGT